MRNANGHLKQKLSKQNLQRQDGFVNLYPNEYSLKMYFIEKTTAFDNWFKKLNDLRAKAKILFRLQKLENEEHFGDCKPIGNGISELKINYAKGYRIYSKKLRERLLFC